MSRSSVMGGAAAFCLAGTSAFAQVAQQPVGLEEVVVTAQRRAEDLQTVPIALTAFPPKGSPRKASPTPRSLSS